MATREDIRRIALSLPGVSEGGNDFGFSVQVKGKPKGFVWSWKVRVDPKKGRVPHDSWVAVAVTNLSAKEALLASDQAVYFTEPHYNGYPAVLVRTENIGLEELEDLLIEGWRKFASKALIAEFEAPGR